MHAEVDGAAVARVFNLRDVLELIENGLDEGALAQQEPVGELEELLAHVLAQFGDEAQALVEEELLSQWRRDVALVTKEPAEEPVHQARDRTTVVRVAGSEAEGQQLSAVIHDQVEFEPVKPAHRRLTAPCVNTKDVVLLDTRRVAHRE